MGRCSLFTLPVRTQSRLSSLMLPSLAGELLLWLVLGHVVQVALLGLMRYHPVLAFCILPAFLATPYLVPLRVVVARWFTAATAFVFFMGAMKVFVQDREDKELGVKLRKEAFHQYMLRFIPLKASPSQNYAPYAMYRVGAILIKYTLANALFIEHAACLENRPSSLIQEIAYRYATGLGVYLWVNSMSEPVMVFWMLVCSCTQPSLPGIVQHTVVQGPQDGRHMRHHTAHSGG